MTPSLITVMFSDAADRGFRLLGIRTHLFSYRGDRQVVSRAIDGYEFGLVSPFFTLGIAAENGACQCVHYLLAVIHGIAKRAFCWAEFCITRFLVRCRRVFLKAVWR